MQMFKKKQRMSKDTRRMIRPTSIPSYSPKTDQLWQYDLSDRALLYIAGSDSKGGEFRIFLLKPGKKRQCQFDLFSSTLYQSQIDRFQY